MSQADRPSEPGPRRSSSGVGPVPGSATTPTAATASAPGPGGWRTRDGVSFHRPSRAWPTPLDAEPLTLPQIPARRPETGGRWTMLLPMVGSLAMVGFAFVVHSLVYLIVIGMMVIGMVGATLATQLVSRRQDRRQWARTRSRFLEVVERSRALSEQASTIQRAGLEGLYPGPEAAFELVSERDGVWERRRSDHDFAWVRLGVGRVPAVRPVVPADDTHGISEPDPDLAAAADEAIRATQVLDGAPVTIPLGGLGVLAVIGPPASSRALVGAWMIHLASFHAPGELRIAALVPTDAVPEWDWLKWLPHCRDPQGGEGFGRARRSVTTDPLAFEAQLSELVRHRLERARGYEPHLGERASPDTEWDHVVIVVDGWRPERSPRELDALMAAATSVGITVVTLVGGADSIPTVCGATVTFTSSSPDGQGGERVRYVEAGPLGRIENDIIPDRIHPELAQRVARRLAPLRLDAQSSGASVGDSVRLTELLGADDPAEAAEAGRQITLADLGRPDNLLLRVPIGRDDNGKPLELDLREAAAGGMGPHGMLVGATGSGKSELLRSLAAALAVRHRPDVLNLLLIDFKGGAAFAGLEALPQVAGLVTNLADEPDLIVRVQAALAGELERRQRLLRDCGDLDSIRDYHAQLRRQGGQSEMPYLVVVVDEFGELLVAQPDFVDTFNAIGRLGRSLGIHLLLSTQRLDEGRVRTLEPHLRYRLALRTYTAGESRSVLGSPAAYELPPVPGLGYLSVDEGLTRFKAAIATLPYRPPDRSAGPLTTEALRPLTLLPARGERTSGDSGNGSSRSELDVMVAAIAQRRGPQARPVWLAPLPAALTIGALEQTFPGLDARRSPALGLVDHPRTQSQEPLVWDPHGTGGNLGVAGAPRTGKSTFLVSLILTLCNAFSPEEAQFYCLDLGGGSLFALDALPHVGAVIGPGEAEATVRLLQDMRALVAELSARRRAGDRSEGEPLVFLVVDNVALLRQSQPELEQELSAVATTGLQHGLHVVVSANRWFDVRPQLLDALGTKLELRLGDPSETLSQRAAARRLPLDRPGRGITRDGEMFQLVLPSWELHPGAGIDGVALRDTLTAIVTRSAGAPRAPRIAALPDVVHESEVPALALAAGSPAPDPNAGFVLGVSEFRSRPAQIELLRAGAHLAVYGDAGSGRSTILRRALAYLFEHRSPQELRAHVVDPARSLIDFGDDPHVDNYVTTSGGAEKVAVALAGELARRLPPDGASVAELRSGGWWDGPQHVLVVDDYDMLSGTLGSPLAPLAELVAQAGEVGLHLLVARRVAGSARSSFEPFSQQFRELRPTTLVLSGSADEGVVAGGITARPLTTGRGFLIVRAGRHQLIQCCLPDGAP
jgi:S-DNA-T family DNA segregation ATPase FtsK/SpoIIIE